MPRRRCRSNMRKPLLPLLTAFILGLVVGTVGLNQTPQTRTQADLRTIYQFRSASVRTGYEEATAYADSFDISADLAAEILRQSRRAGVPPRIGFRLVRRESSFNPTAVSRIGALGLTQIRLGTAKMLKPDVSRRELLTDKPLNLILGFSYLQSLYVRFDSSWYYALRAYVDGPTDVARGSKAGSAYAEDILGRE